MNYLSPAQFARIWGISANRITILAKEGRIPGALRIGYRWLIPENTEKPADNRTAIAKAEQKEPPSFFRYPSFEGRDADSFLPPLSPEERQIKRTSEAFHACRFEEAENLLADLPKTATDRYHRIYALYLSCMISFSLCKIDGFLKDYNNLSAELHDHFPFQKEFSSLIPELDAIRGLTGFFVKGFSVDPAYAYHESYFSHLARLSVVAKNYSPLSRITAADLSACECLCATLDEKKQYVDMQAIHLHLGILYTPLNDSERMNFHYRKALNLAETYDLFYQPAVLNYYYGGSFQTVLSEFSPAFCERLLALSDQIHKSYTDFTEAASAHSIYSRLENRDFFYLFCAAQSYTSKKVAELLHVSCPTVRNHYKTIYKAMHVRNKAELAALYRKSVEEK